MVDLERHGIIIIIICTGCGRGAASELLNQTNPAHIDWIIQPHKLMYQMMMQSVIFFSLPLSLKTFIGCRSSPSSPLESDYNGRVNSKWSVLTKIVLTKNIIKYSWFYCNNTIFSNRFTIERNAFFLQFSHNLFYYFIPLDQW